MKFEDVFKSVESLEAYLKEAANSTEFRELRNEAEKGTHPTQALLEQYVSDTCNEETSRETAEHIALCRICSKEAARLRELLEPAEFAQEVEPDLVEPVNVDEIVQSVESFDAFLRQGYNSPEFCEMRAEAERLPPLPLAVLVGYVIDTLDEDTAYQVMEHVSFNSKAAREVAWLSEKATQIGNLGDWFAKLKDGLERRFIELLAPPLQLELAEMTPKEGGPAEHAVVPQSIGMRLAQHRIPPPGEFLACEVETRKDGHVWILLYGEEDDGPLEWVFPHNKDPDTAIAAHTAKIIDVEVRVPPAEYHLKAIWTAEQLIDPRKVDFDNRFEAKEAMNTFFQRLRGLPREQWGTFRQEIFP
ncbi:MAG: hypothetical protein V2B18_05495 [Pseudomonadota bacterium]